ncbi:NAD(P)-dependent dehydrogenase, short-chain alcohol dehydrogenase family [Frankia canadensis]|uniref:NAD(P)-dependent dehydrogenase, short-chain alcohol dehydrogenase family n=1 Tax=Frankia canadensis TaxID=1836972 RepID=A0A2I2KHW1_9ACTN|nr:SDR family oxidoreductase [Frankia canadensis]SNQ45257.1 NAD(P)-dependent dehydrogenase, short-chain alcohol dehydrogenase family [Frankia canadensis]SOU52547.1 NAD(P)-dependent dehydrogenase, short-chain alcohol dehydrogenase family [Frankia canadensis]
MGAERPRLDAPTGWGPFSLTGRRALVTGAAGGIGRAIVTRLLDAGAEVVATDRHLDRTNELAALVPECRYLSADLSVPDEVEALFARAVAAAGPIDLLVNNAALITSALLPETDADLLDKVYAVNFRAPILLSRAYAELAASDSPGAIVNIGSAGGVRAVRVGSSAYGSLKAALGQATAYLARELGPRGIVVNAVAPGSIASGHSVGRSREASAASRRLRDEIRGRSALGRLGVPDDVALVVVFLASPAAAFITGQTLLVDGGWLLG